MAASGPAGGLSGSFGGKAQDYWGTPGTPEEIEGTAVAEPSNQRAEGTPAASKEWQSLCKRQLKAAAPFARADVELSCCEGDSGSLAPV